MASQISTELEVDLTSVGQPLPLELDGDEFYTPVFSQEKQRPHLLLVYSRFDAVERATDIPINLLYLGSYLRARGVEVTMLDGAQEDRFEEYFLEKAADVTAVGISAMTFQLPNALDLVARLKSKFPSKPVLMGGVHPTLFTEQMIQDPGIDYVVKGEGEIPILRILDVVLGHYEQEELKHAPGVAFRDKNGQIHLPKEYAEQVNYRDYPEVDYTLIRPDVLQAYAENDLMYFPMISSRGCPYRCTFCINVVVPNTKFRNWTPKRLIREFERVRDLVGIERPKFWIWDEIFLLNKVRNRQIAHQILEAGLEIEYTSSARADFFKDGFLDVDTLRLMKKSGMHRVSIGVESGSQKVLDYLQKDLDRSLILQSAEVCQEADVRPSYSFMVGLPPEEDVDVLDTLKVIDEIDDRIDSWSVVGPQIFRPYPGSTILPDCEKAGWEPPESNKQWVQFVQDENYSPDARDVPWIKNPGLVNTVYFYTALVALKPKRLVSMFREFCDATGQGAGFRWAGTVAVLGASFFGKFRIKTGWYGIFFERSLFGAIRRKYISF